MSQGESSRRRGQERARWALLALAVAGALISGYLGLVSLRGEFPDPPCYGVPDYCAYAADRVLERSDLGGVPGPLLGVLAYAVIAIGAWWRIWWLSAIVSAGALLFSLYLVAAEVFVRDSICQLCRAHLVVILLTTPLAMLIFLGDASGRSKPVARIPGES